MTKQVADMLVVSDLHAMSGDVDVERFVTFVTEHPARVLVLAGDSIDLYLWRHSRGYVDVGAGMRVLRFLIERVMAGQQLVILPGNHDLDWEWLVAGAVVPRRMQRVAFPDGMRELMELLVQRDGVRVVNRLVVGDTVIVHGHEGWQGDWLWRVSEMGDRLTGHRLVGGQMRRNVMGRAPMGLRAAAVEGHGFYRRLGRWARWAGAGRVIHGHTHVEGTRVRCGVVMECLPAWRKREGRG